MFEISDVTINIVILFVVFGGIMLFAMLWEKYRNYTEEDYKLRRIEKESDNTYYFEIPLMYFQYKKRQGIRERYRQNSIIYCEKDDSYHRVLKWGANVQGIQRIIAEPYIIEERIPTNNYTIYLSNQGSVCVELFVKNEFNELYQEIVDTNLKKDLREKQEILGILQDIMDRKVVCRKAIEYLYTFLEKNKALLSCTSDVLSIVASIIEMIK